MSDLLQTEEWKAGGRIFRVKTGYNPNSSSVGSQIPYFFAFALSSGTLTILIMNLLSLFDQHIKACKTDTASGPDQNENGCDER